MTKIFYEEIKKDESGTEWLYINGDTGYLLTGAGAWSKEEARADYLSEKATLERQVDFMCANGFYD